MKCVSYRYVDAHSKIGSNFYQLELFEIKRSFERETSETFSEDRDRNGGSIFLPVCRIFSLPLFAVVGARRAERINNHAAV